MVRLHLKLLSASEWHDFNRFCLLFRDDWWDLTSYELRQSAEDSYSALSLANLGVALSKLVYLYVYSQETWLIDG